MPEINLANTSLLFRHLINSYRHGIVQSCQQTGISITYGEVIILLRLMGQGGLTQSDLSRALLKDKASINRLIKKLSEKHWVESQRGTKDRRIILICLTPEGNLVSQSIFSLISKYDAAMLSDISQEGIETTTFILRRMIDNISNI